jgi:hypothetical protein
MALPRPAFIEQSLRRPGLGLVAAAAALTVLGVVVLGDSGIALAAAAATLAIQLLLVALCNIPQLDGIKENVRVLPTTLLRWMTERRNMANGRSHKTLVWVG